MNTKICRDCQHHDPMTHMCLHSRSEQVDIVTGDFLRQTCYQMRIWPCGSEGRFWEDKKA